jgi:hypothetical protein
MQNTYHILKDYKFTQGAFTLDVRVDSSFEYPQHHASHLGLHLFIMKIL